MKQKIIFNWSGGKDSALCLHKMMDDKDSEIMCLMTSIAQQNQRISMHGVRAELLEIQAERIGIPLVKMEVPEMPSMTVYEEVLKETLTGLKNKGANASAYGDIFLEDLRTYREKMLSELNLSGIFPLWNIPTRELISEFIDLGFKTITSCVNDKYLDASFVGRVIDNDFLKDLPKDVDPCGENGEFHTFVFDGPIFREPISIVTGELVYRKYNASGGELSSDSKDEKVPGDKDPFANGYWYVDLLINESADLD